MAHGTHLSDKLPASLKWTLAVLIVLTLVFGIHGHLNYERTAGEGEAARSSGQPAATHESSFVDVASAVYHSIQLLIVHGVHLPGKIPRSLHLARFLGAFAFFLGGVLAALVLVRDGMLRLRLRVPWRRDDVVICGLGDLGLRPAPAARGKNKFVVAIDDDAKGGASQQRRDRGACDRWGRLRQAGPAWGAGIDGAEFIAVVCGDDATNIAIAASIGRALQKVYQATTAPVPPVDQRSRVASVTHGSVGPFRVGRSRIAKPAASLSNQLRRSRPACDGRRQCLREHELDFQPIREGDRRGVT